MRAARSMAPLAVNSLRDFSWKRGIASSAIGVFPDCRVCVMAEETFLCNPPAKVRLIRPVVARVHAPVTTIFGIPAYRKFDQLLLFVKMQVSAGVIAGAEDIINFLFNNIDRLSVRT